jgi:hypothetical protein
MSITIERLRQAVAKVGTTLSGVGWWKYLISSSACRLQLLHAADCGVPRTTHLRNPPV